MQRGCTCEDRGDVLRQRGGKGSVEIARDIKNKAAQNLRSKCLCYTGLGWFDG